MSGIFDAAWAVSKMPLDYDSIREDDRGDFRADFIDPKTGRRYGMTARNRREYRIRTRATRTALRSRTALSGLSIETESSAI